MNELQCKISTFSNIVALEYLYNSTDGQTWNWGPIETFGNIWNFSKNDDSYFQNPCLDNWQGVCCSNVDPSVSAYCRSSIDHVFLEYYWVPPPNNCSTQISGLILSFNISGSIPEQFYDLTSLEYLSLYNNHLIGTISSSIGMLTNLQALDFSYNFLTSSVPQSLFNISGAMVIFLDYNYLTGTFPLMPQNCSALQVLTISHNYFSGEIPKIDRARDLLMVSLANNMFSGAISDQIVKLRDVVFFSVQFNWLTGRLPTITALTALKSLILSSNYFSGSIAQLVMGLSQLHVLQVSHNHFTGAVLSASMSNMQNLEKFMLDNNHFTGTISAGIGQLVLCQYFSISSNQLHGAIPSAIGRMASLTSLKLDHNSLTGTVPLSLSLLTTMSIVLLGYNSLSGHISDCWSNASMVSVVDLGDNNFSGTLPFILFELRFVSTIILSKNCFSGHIYESGMCNPTLRTISMAGLSAGGNCRRPLLFSSYTVSEYMHGSVPACMYALPSLETLDMSGNGLSGHLSSGGIDNFATTIKNLSLSHNRFKGSIPSIFLHQSFINLDLSFNKLSSTLPPDIANSQQLVLQVNRLSGVIPSSMYSMTSINILNGNLFGCQWHSQLPSQDPHALMSECGSHNLTNLLILSGSLLVVCLAMAISGVNLIYNQYSAYVSVHPSSSKEAFAHQHHRPSSTEGMISSEEVFATPKSPRELMFGLGVTTAARAFLAQLARHYDLSRDLWKFIYLIQRHRQDSDITLLRDVRHFMGAMTAVQILSLFLTVVILMGFLPLELSVKMVGFGKYSTHTVQYAYFPSLAFISGDLPAIIVTILVGIFVLLVYSTNVKIYHNDSAIEVLEAANIVEKPSSWQRILLLTVALPVLDIVVIGSVNIGYLYYYYHFSNPIIAQFIIVAFKLVWNNKVLTALVNQCELNNSQLLSSGNSSILLSVLTLLNNIILPLFITMCVDPGCFFNVFIPPAPTEIWYDYQECSGTWVGVTGCYEVSDVQHSQYTPPFIYGYQCSSSVLVYYVPVFVLTYTFYGFLLPLWTIMLVYLHDTGRKTEYWQIVDYFNDYILLPKQYFVDLVNAGATHGKQEPGGIITPAILHPPIVSSRDICVSQICHLSVLLTFGAAYPPLGLLVSFTMAVQAVIWRTLIGRYLGWCLLMEFTISSQLLQLLNRSCCGAKNIFVLTQWLMASFMVSFFAFFVFDMARDNSVGKSYGSAVWTAASLFMWAGCVWSVGLAVNLPCFKHGIAEIIKLIFK